MNAQELVNKLNDAEKSTLGGAGFAAMLLNIGMTFEQNGAKASIKKGKQVVARLQCVNYPHKPLKWELAR